MINISKDYVESSSFEINKKVEDISENKILKVNEDNSDSKTKLNEEFLFSFDSFDDSNFDKTDDSFLLIYKDDCDTL